MKRCSPPSSAIRSSPGRKCRWYVLPSRIVVPSARSSSGSTVLTVALRPDRHERRRRHVAVRGAQDARRARRRRSRSTENVSLIGPGARTGSAAAVERIVEVAAVLEAEVARSTARMPGSSRRQSSRRNVASGFGGARRSPTRRPPRRCRGRRGRVARRACGRRARRAAGRPSRRSRPAGRSTVATGSPSSARRRRPRRGRSRRRARRAGNGSGHWLVSRGRPTQAVASSSRPATVSTSSMLARRTFTAPASHRRRSRSGSARSTASPVEPPRLLHAGEGHHEREQRRARQVEVRQQRVGALGTRSRA